MLETVFSSENNGVPQIMDPCFMRRLWLLVYCTMLALVVCFVVSVAVAFLGLSEDRHRAMKYLERSCYPFLVIIFLYLCGISGPAHFERQSLAFAVISGWCMRHLGLGWSMLGVAYWSAPDVHGHDPQYMKKDQRMMSHSFRFFDLAGNAIDVSVNLPWYTSPTVRHWRTILAREHFLGSPSFRWVLLVDMDTEEVVDDDDEVLFPNASVGDESCRFYAIMRHCPALVRRLETAKQRNDYMLALRVIEQYPDQFDEAADHLRGVREIAEAVLEQLSNSIFFLKVRTLYLERKLRS